MVKSILTGSAIAVVLAGCGTTTQTTQTTTTARTAQERSVWVEPTTGSHIGGGYVHIPGATRRGGEPGVVAAIQSLDADGASSNRHPFALQAVAQVSGASEQQITTQWKQTNLHLGELLAFNLLARNDDNKVRQLASVRAAGKSWTQLASSSGVNINTLAQKIDEASSLSANLYVHNSGGNGAAADSTVGEHGVVSQGQSAVGAPPTSR